MTRCLFAAAALALLPLLACGRTGAASNGAGADPPAATEARAPSSDVLVLDPGKLASIKVDVIREREMPRTLTVAGKVQLDEDRVARILAPLGGQILDLHVKVGDPVRKGEALCAISSREAAAAIAEHAESHKDLDLADKTLAMTGDLFEHQAASKIALQQAQNDQAKARSRVARTPRGLSVRTRAMIPCAVDAIWGGSPVSIS